MCNSDSLKVRIVVSLVFFLWRPSAYVCLRHVDRDGLSGNSLRPIGPECMQKARIERSIPPSTLSHTMSESCVLSVLDWTAVLASMLCSASIRLQHARLQVEERTMVPKRDCKRKTDRCGPASTKLPIWSFLVLRFCNLDVVAWRCFRSIVPPSPMRVVARDRANQQRIHLLPTRDACAALLDQPPVPSAESATEMRARDFVRFRACL